MRVVILVDELQFDPADPTYLVTPPAKEVEAEYSVADALRTLGHTVTVNPVTADVGGVIEKIKASRPQLAFNLVEQINGKREHDSFVAQLLEILGIPYTGASPDVLMTARNKQLAKMLVARSGVSVAPAIVANPGDRLSHVPLRFPVIIKPLHLDGSDGVTGKSFVRTPAALRARLAHLMHRAPRAYLCEEYVPGRELVVSMSGVGQPSVDSICELAFSETAPVQFATQSAKFDRAFRERYGIRYHTPASVDRLVARKLAAAGRAAYMALKINAYAKIEFRVDGDRIIFIEANPNSLISRFSKTTDFGSIGYERFIRKVIRMALRRG